jgi:hypothetical protein
LETPNEANAHRRQRSSAGFFGQLSDKARREPAVITEHGRDPLVVLPKRRNRRVGLAEDLPEEWIEAVRRA